MANETLNLLEETDFIINDISYSVTHISLSKLLTRSPSVVYLNIITKENNSFTVKLTSQGFKVVARRLDEDEGDDACALDDFPPAFETVYSLLENISPGYVASFANALSSKLNDLQKLKDHQEDGGKE